MKKNVIVAVVLLAAALGALKYFSSREASDAPPSGTQVEGQAPGGVALPADAGDYGNASTESVYAPAQAMGSYDALTLPAAAFSVKGACEGGSPKDIVENHNRTWGYFTGRRTAFKQDKTKALYDFMGDYYACMAAARQDLSYCNDLPGELDTADIKLDVSDSPLGYCRSKAGLFLFKAYIAGKAKERQNCIGYVNDWDSQNLSRISPQDFCNAAAEGPEAITKYASSKLPDIWPTAERIMAFSRRVCGSDRDCLDNNKLWEGISTGNAKLCPPQYRAHCEALIEKSQVPCVAVLNEMSKKYCVFLKDLNKATMGYSGMNEEELKEELRKLAEKKAAEERQRKEEEARTKEINSRVKKMLGTQGE